MTKKRKKFDIVVGIPSFNNEKTIGHVIKAVYLGLIKYFPNFSSLIINSDGGSKDKTVEIFKKYYLNNNDLKPIILHKYHPAAKKIVKPEKISRTYKGIPGKGSALKNIFEIRFCMFFWPWLTFIRIENNKFLTIRFFICSSNSNEHTLIAVYPKFTIFFS